MTEDLEILVNPPDHYWQKAVNIVVREEHWINSYHEYASWKKEIGENFTFLVAVDKNSKEFVGCITITNYEPVKEGEEGISMIGMFAVAPEFRGCGAGSFIFQEGLKRAKERKFLYGAPAMQQKYADKFGFNKLPEWKAVVRHATVNRVRPLLLNHDPTLELKTPAAVGWDNISKHLNKYTTTVDVTPMVKAILTQKESHALVALTAENRIVGLGAVRENLDGILSVGPLIGNDVIAASSVLRGILLQMNNLYEFKDFIMFSPTINEESGPMMRQLCEGEFKTHYETATQPQFTHEIIEVPIQHVYATGQNDICLL